MTFHADLHIHSKHAYATSPAADLPRLAEWAARKGITVLGTGDFTHPAWLEELETLLRPAEPGLFRLERDVERAVYERLPQACRRPVRFMLQVEIATIQPGTSRAHKVHHLIYVPTLDAARALRRRLGRIGNLDADGRPILGIAARDLLEITLEVGRDCYLIPAHIWTPWFSALGSRSGFDSIDECYADLASHVFAVETGLSSDPPLNRRVSRLDRFTLVSNSDAHSPPMIGREACVFECELDYFAMRRALETGVGYGGTVEFYPEEGKYHLDGHRKCRVRLHPTETRILDSRCPVCQSPLTLGVLNRIEALSDRADARGSTAPDRYSSLVALPEVLSELTGVGAKSKRVALEQQAIAEKLGPELCVMLEQPLEDLRKVSLANFDIAIDRMRTGCVRIEPGFDGAYGRVRLFEPGELATSRPSARPTHKRPIAKESSAHPDSTSTLRD